MIVRITLPILIGVMLLGCASPSQVPSYSELMKDDPLHLSQFPADAPLPFDGIWEDPWGETFVFQAGRAFLGEFIYPMVVLSAIRPLEEGVFTAEATDSMQFVGDDLRVIPQADGTLVVRSSVSDRVLTAVKLFHPENFQSARDLARRIASIPPPAATSGPSISKLTVVPAVSTPGQELVFSSVYTVSDFLASEDLRARFSYRIFDGAELLFEGTTIALAVPDQSPQSREVRIRASDSPGLFEFEARLSYDGTLASVRVPFRIVERDALLDLLTGQWRIKSAAVAEERQSTLTIRRAGDGIEGTMDYDALFDEHYAIDSFAVTLDGTTLRIRSRIKSKPSPHFSCWMLLEDEVQLTATLDELPVRTVMVDGDPSCVRIGEVFRSTMVRADR